MCPLFLDRLVWCAKVQSPGFKYRPCDLLWDLGQVTSLPWASVSTSIKQEQCLLVVRMEHEKPAQRSTHSTGSPETSTSCPPYSPHPFTHAPATQHAGGGGGAQMVCLKSPPVMKMSAAEKRSPVLL